MSRTPSQPGGPHGTGGKPAQSVPHGPARTAATPAAGRPPAGAPGQTPTTAAAQAAAAPAAPAPVKASALATRRNIVIGASAAGLALLVALVAWKPWAPSPPRLNEDPAVIAKWAASSLHRLPFDQQRQYMELLDEKDKRVEEAYEQGILSDQEYRRALQLGWYGEHLRKMDNFFEKPPTLRAMYLDKQVDKKVKKKQKRKDGPEPDDKSALTAGEIERDDSTEEQDINRWPSDVRQRWADYRAAYASRKQYWKDFAKEQKAAQEANKGAGAKDETDKNDPAAKGPEAAAPTGTPGGQ